MSDLVPHMLSVFLCFFAIMNPVANTAVFVGLTGDEERSAQTRIAFRALLISFLYFVFRSLVWDFFI